MSEYDIHDFSIPKSTRKAFKKFVKRAGLIKPAKWYLDSIEKHAKKYAKKNTPKHELGAEALVSLQSYNDFGKAYNFRRKTYYGPSSPFYRAVHLIMTLYVSNDIYKGDFPECEEVFEDELYKMHRTVIEDWLRVDPIAVAHKLKNKEVCRLIAEVATLSSQERKST